MTKEQKAEFIEALKTITTPSQTQAVELPEGWTLLSQNVPLFMSNRENEIACAKLFPNADHATATWINRIAAQIRGDILVDDIVGVKRRYRDLHVIRMRSRSKPLCAQINMPSTYTTITMNTHSDWNSMISAPYANNPIVV